MQGLYASTETLINSRLSSEQRRVLYAALTLYVFRGCTQSDIKKALNGHRIEFDFLSWRKDLHRNGLLLKDSKVWLYSTFCTGKKPKGHLSLDDRKALSMALKSPALNRHLNYLKTDYGAVPLTIPELDRRIHDSLYSSDVSAFIKSTVHNKMGFLVKSFGWSPPDLVNELRIGALFTLLKSYPRYEDIGHMRAICKSQVHNQAVNMIKHQTAIKRQRLHHNRDGTYSSLFVPLYEFSTDGVMSSGSDSDLVTSSYLVTGLDGVSQSSWERSFCMREILSSGSFTSKQKEFLKILLGEPSRGFSEFLGEDNTESIHNRKYDVYVKAACKYLGIPHEAGLKFILSLKDKV